MIANSGKVRHLRYENLRRSLQETVSSWPHLYEHKIIGKNAEPFREGIKAFEQDFPRLNRKQAIESKNGAYISFTYEVLARDVDEIINLWVRSEEVLDFVTIL